MILEGLKRGLLVLVSLALSLIVVEWTLRILDLPPSDGGHQRAFIEHDALRGWRNVPGAEGRLTTAEYDVRLEYNDRGFRGPLPSYEKPDGTLRVLLLGDSFVEGYTVSRERRTSAVLEEELRKRLAESTEAEIIALGTAGYSTDQELLWLETEGLRYDPDVVVLFFHPNDVWFNARDRYSKGYKPRFVLRGDSLVLTGVPVPPPDVEGTDSGDAHDGLLTSLREAWPKSRLYRLAARAGRRIPGLHTLAVRLGLAGMPPETMFDETAGKLVPEEFRVYRSNSDPAVERAWRVTRALLERAGRSSESRGAQFVVFVIPFRAVVYGHGSDPRVPGESAQGWNPEAPTRRLLAICREAGLRCVDPTDRYRETARDLASRGERLYFRYDWHWNERGHRLAAEVLAERIEALVGTDSSSAPGDG